jgi:hydroxymethylpyrimidine/phosphomethylpyrimidine kinase
MHYMKPNKIPCVVTIAGTDPSGGAGIQADIKAISATGCYAASIITALVAQNTQGVQAIQEVPLAFIDQQIESVFSDLTVHAVKIGMLHNKKVIELITSKLEKYKPDYVVLDPVMVAKDGSSLMEPDTIAFLKENLFSLATLITPNLPEAEKILSVKIHTVSDMECAAKKIGENVNVLLKGGHLETERSSDVLYVNSEMHWFHAERIKTKNTHGTGCSLSSAIASYLAQGYFLPEAVSAAKQYLTKAIQSGSQFQIGRGHGPVDHFYFLRNKKS